MNRIPTLPPEQLLSPGMRLTQEEFHRRYELYPDNVKFELIGGVVYMASPQRRPHGYYELEMAGLLWMYKSATPGVEGLRGSTAILNDTNEPEPDLTLRIFGAYGGQSHETEENYVAGPPELLIEVAHSTVSFDLNIKRPEYERAGVTEYLVINVEHERIHWWNFALGIDIPINRQGIARSRVFPGLWLHPEAILAIDSLRSFALLQRGLNSREHKAFVKRLARQQEQEP